MKNDFLLSATTVVKFLLFEYLKLLLIQADFLMLRKSWTVYNNCHPIFFSKSKLDHSLAWVRILVKVLNIKKECRFLVRKFTPIPLQRQSIENIVVDVNIVRWTSSSKFCSKTVMMTREKKGQMMKKIKILNLDNLIFPVLKPILVKWFEIIAVFELNVNYNHIPL